MRTALVLLAAATLMLAGCSDGGGASTGRLNVVTTTAVLGDFARQVAGPDADVSVVIPAGVDIHSFDPPPAAARSVAAARVIVVNGYHLEESVLRVVAANKKSGTTVVVAAAGLTPRAAVEEHEEERGHEDEVKGLDPLATAEGDPHLWLSVGGARKYVENIRDGLAKADPEHAEGYHQRAAAYLETLTELDAELRTTLAKVPAAKRQIVTFHDSFGYFAEAYDFKLTASVLPGGANQQVSAQKVAEVVAAVKAAGVPTIFREPGFDSAVLDSIARETGTRVGTLQAIYTDSVNDYPAMMRANAQALVEGLAR